MKIFLALLLIAAATARDVSQTPAEDFLKGFFYEIEESGKPSVLIACMGDLSDFKTRMKMALELIIKLTYADISNAVKIIVQVSTEFFAKLDGCVKDFPALKVLVKRIRNTQMFELFKTLYFSGEDLKAYAVKAFNCYAKKNFVCVGKNIGKIAYTIYLDDLPGKPEDDVGLKFITGFLKGIGETEPATELMKCLKDLQGSIKKIKDGLEEMKKGDFVSIMKGFRMVLEGVREILDKGSHCFEKYKVVKRLVEQMGKLELEKMFRKLMNNLGRFVLDVDFAINSFINKDYESAGKAIGDIMKFLFLD
eukprot:TRINITY_DN676_c0_g1_i10.p1 TRINITY_DN676_c0_g1~~TRINITY_DN676_c0_g1_i10.p1  ORF type:complete len:307 (-),score=90.87 TRINITY_DN676_c0_g1_i10:140-1060(-)